MNFNWSLVLTAGVTSAIVSALVSFVSTIITLRIQRKKDAFEKFFPQLQKMRNDLIEIPQQDLSALTSLVDQSEVNTERFTRLLSTVRDYFAECENLFLKNEFLFAPDLRKILREKLDAIYTEQEKLVAMEESAPDNIIPVSTITEDTSRKVLFCMDLMDRIDEQMARFSKHYHA